nr:reverse transcriptase domain-containing protein [Tanacetum cinerariifolium]
MTTDNLSPTPALTLSDKLMAMNHLTTFVLEKHDVDAMNYSSWVYYFSHLCHGYGILDHLVDLVASSSTTTPTNPPPKDAEWTKIDFCMRTRSSSNLVGESSKQPFSLEESPLDTMADQRTMAKLLRAPTKGYVEAIMVPPILAEHFELKHSLINMMTSDQFSDLRKTIIMITSVADQDSLNSVAGGNLLERCTQDVLTIIENKSKVSSSRNKLIVFQVKSSDVNSSSSSEIAKLTHAVNQQTSAVTTSMTAILKQFQATTPPASVKAIEEICVTCGGAHPFYQCLFTDGNTFLEFQDNIKGYVSAAAINYNQGNEMQTSIQASMSNQTNELKNMMASFFQMNTASTLGSRPLPSNTIANPKGELKAITTHSGLVLDGPFVPMPPPFINLEEDERVEETLTDPKLAEYML